MRLGVALRYDQGDIVRRGLFGFGTILEADIQQERLDNLFVRLFGGEAARFDSLARG